MQVVDEDGTIHVVPYGPIAEATMQASMHARMRAHMHGSNGRRRLAVIAVTTATHILYDLQCVVAPCIQAEGGDAMDGRPREGRSDEAPMCMHASMHGSNLWR